MDRQQHRPAGPPVLALVSALALAAPTVSPFTEGVVRLPSAENPTPTTALQSTSNQERASGQLHDLIGGSDVPVTYLTFGYWSYFLGNPAAECRYPSPVFLERLQDWSQGMAVPSYRENLKCLSAPSSRWLVVQSSWFDFDDAPPEMIEIIETEWDCTRAVQAGALHACPRRD